MFFIKYRPIIIGFLILVGLYMHFTEGISVGIYFYVAALLMILTELLFGNSVLAFNLLKRGNPEMAADVLGRTWLPSMLVKSRKAYYHFTKGMLALQIKELDEALENLEIANHLGLKKPLDNALNALNIAHIYFAKKNKAKAKEFLDKTKSYTVNDLMLKEKISEMERALKKMKR